MQEPPVPPAPPLHETVDMLPPPAPTAPKGLSARSFGLLGLVVGLVVGVVVGLAIGSDGKPADVPELSKPAFAAAVGDCGVTGASGITLLDDGNSLQLRTAGKESSGAEYADVLCVLKKLEIPESVISRMDSTRSLDGRQEGSWEQYEASWGYHPDQGLNVIIEMGN